MTGLPASAPGWFRDLAVSMASNPMITPKDAFFNDICAGQNEKMNYFAARRTKDASFNSANERTMRAGVEALVSFADDKQNFGPPFVTHGGLQATLFKAVLSLVVDTNAGELRELRVDYKGKVASPGFYRVLGRIVSIPSDGLRLAGVLEMQSENGEWAVLATSTALWTIGAAVINPIPRPPRASLESSLILSADIKHPRGFYMTPIGLVEAPTAGGGFIWSTLHIPSVVPRFEIRAAETELFGDMELGPKASGGGGTVSEGVVFTMLDQFMGVYAAPHFAKLPAGTFTATAYMTLKVIEMPPTVPCKLEWRAWVDKIEGKKVFARSEVTLEGRVVCKSEALFIVVPAPKM